ncbi:type IX secretion system membrane protein PorP/SprF [Maribacter sp. 2210JD10-5]|uniref:PorP/SprF family type IX secretion system membrane protein n=1 Tax=Maribacter sp. 2210JD10-5 TaxID=3386272 RepID=UPI0039BCD2AA
MKGKIINPSYCCQFLLLSFLFFFSIEVKSQKEPQYTQYMYNIGSFNPAYVGSVEAMDLTALYRAQWIDIPGAPRTIRLGTNIPLKNEKHGLGFNIVNDQLGPVTQTYFDLSYSFQVNLSSNSYLSFGVDAGGSALNVDFSKGTFRDPGEPFNGQNVSNFYPTIGAGLFMYSTNWYLGASVPNFLTEGIYNDEVATVVDDRLQFNFIGGYVFEISDNFKFKPAFLINALQGNPLNVNLSANFLFANAFTVGASFRLENAFSGLAGFQISKGTFIGYSYDYNTNPLGEFNNGSHEMIIKFTLGKGTGNKTKGNREKELKNKPKQIDSPRFF